MKVTFENHNLFPIWFPDGKRILFITRGRTNYLNAVAADGSSTEPETLATNGEPQVPLTWVPGTDLVLVAQVRAETRQDLELFQMTDRTWRHWLQTRFDELEARVSPDGRWVAYTSDQTGQPEVWVRSFLDAGNPVRVSTDGGRDAVWSPDGRELFYRNGSRMMAVKVRARRADDAGRVTAAAVRRRIRAGVATRIRCRAGRPLPDDRGGYAGLVRVDRLGPQLGAPDQRPRPSEMKP